MNAPALRLADYWMGRNETHADDLTAEIVRNATHLLRRVNNLLVLMHDIQIEPHPITGTPIASGLAQKERELSNLSWEYLTYANAITGHCPESLGVPLAEPFIHHYAGWEV